MDIIAPLILQAVLIFLNAVFAMAEIAVIQTSDARLSKKADEGNKKARRILKLKSQPARFLATIQIAITLSGFLGSAFAADNFAGYFAVWLDFLPFGEAVVESIAVVLITLILSYVSLILGELVPKRIAMRKAENVSLKLSGTLSAVAKIFAPIVWFLSVSTNGVLRLIGIDPNADEEEVSEEDILMMADAGAEQGIIDEEEREIIENIFEFDDTNVGELTTHRTDVATLWVEDSDEEWQKAIRSTHYTYYPICDGSVDNVVGVLYTKDYFRLENPTRENVMAYAVKAPFFVPESAKAHITFRKMKKQGISFAVVLDEYAGFAGILTIKDLIEEIVGDISDESEEIKEEELQKLEENKWRISGNVSLAVLSKTLDREFPDEFDSFSGFVTSLTGDVPEDGSQFEVETEEYHIQVSDVVDHQITGAVITVKEKIKEEE